MLNFFRELKIAVRYLMIFGLCPDRRADAGAGDHNHGHLFDCGRRAAASAAVSAAG